MDRRPLATLLALGLIGAVPASAGAVSPGALFAASPAGTLTDQPSPDLVAQASGGTLSSKPKATGSTETPGASPGTSSGSSSSATATALPFTGSDPRITLMLGVAAVLLGAGLRMRTGDARDY